MVLFILHCKYEKTTWKHTVIIDDTIIPGSGYILRFTLLFECFNSPWVGFLGLQHLESNMYLWAWVLSFSPLLPHLLHNFCNFSFLLTEISVTIANKSLPLKHAAEVSIKPELPKLVYKYTYHLHALHICFWNWKKQCGKILWRVLQWPLLPNTAIVSPQHWFAAEFCTTVQCKKFCWIRCSSF